MGQSVARLAAALGCTVLPPARRRPGTARRGAARAGKAQADPR
ncbi:hypothetical protein [Aestuariivirga sp.]